MKKRLQNKKRNSILKKKRTRRHEKQRRWARERAQGEYLDRLLLLYGAAPMGKRIARKRRAMGLTRLGTTESPVRR